MKTKFDSLLKLKKQDVDKIEVEITKNNHLVALKNQELDTTLRDFNQIDIPQTGDYFDFKRISEMKKTFIYQIEFLKEELSNLKNAGKKIQERYKFASIEYEKIKFLQESEIKKALDLLKKSEAKNLDEIATILFATSKEKA